MFRPTVLLTFLLASLLTACGGDGSGSVVGNTETDDAVVNPGTNDDSVIGGSDSTGDSSDGTVVETGVTYFPHAFLHRGSEYGFDTEAFIIDGTTPFINHYLITPVNSKTLAPVTDAETSDYLVAVDGNPVDENESFPMLQKVVGVKISLDTAIVIDTSGSMDNVDSAALIQGVKDYISAAQASSDSTIKEQRFSVWAFAAADELDCTGPAVSKENIVNLAEFTADSTVLNTALDTLKTNWDARVYGRPSALYHALVKAVGVYTGDGSYNDCEGGAYTFFGDGNNDLIDFATIDEFHLTDVVLVSAGQSDVGGFDADAMTAALSWQSQIVYNTSSDSYDTTNLGKPLIYLAIDGNTDSNVAASAEAVISVASDGSYDFAGSVISAQQESISLRSRDENYYVFRYAFLPRNGEHERTFSSQTNYYSYGLTGTIDLTNGSSVTVGTPEEVLASLVEITTAANDYLANGEVSAGDVARLYPATRWTTQTYTPAEYSWTLGGVAATAATDGSISISGADVGKSVVLTNITRGETASLTIVD